MKKTCVLFGAGADIPFGISGGKNFALKVLGFDANDMNSAIKEYFRSELPNFEHKTWYPPYEQTTWKNIRCSRVLTPQKQKYRGKSMPRYFRRLFLR